MRPNRLSRRAETITKEDLKAVVKGDPREYQMELFEKAKEQNIIAVLDTGMKIRGAWRLLY